MCKIATSVVHGIQGRLCLLFLEFGQGFFFTITYMMSSEEFSVRNLWVRSSYVQHLKLLKCYGANDDQ